MVAAKYLAHELGISDSLGVKYWLRLRMYNVKFLNYRAYLMDGTKNKFQKLPTPMSTELVNMVGCFRIIVIDRKYPTATT